MPSIRRRAALRVAAALVGVSSLTAGLSVHAASPASQDVGTSGSGFPTTATWTGGSVAGNPDPLGPPAPSCTSGCDRETFVLHAPSGFTTTNKINVSATASNFSAGALGTTVDIAILDSSNDVLGSTTGSGSPATVTATDLQPGTYVVEVDGDIGDPTATSYDGSLTVSTSPRTAQAVHASDGGITGSRETLADPFRLGTEPTINISPDGTVYTGPIFGFSTTQSFVMRSDNGGQTFNTLGIPGAGKTTTCPGGGDEDLATDPNNNLYFLDLGGAPVVPAAVSPDHGNTFIDNCVANQDANKPNYFPDRQWLSTDNVNHLEYFIWRDGVVNTSTPTDPVAGPVYGEYIETAPLASGAAGATQLLFTDLCKNPASVGIPCINDVNIAGNAITDNSPTSPHKGITYLAMSRSSGVSLAIIDPNNTTTPVTEVTTVPGAGNILFPTVAVDNAGNIYEAYVDSSTYQVMFTRSLDGGSTWSAPIVVNGAPAATTVMPWIVAGDSGRVDIAYYGSPSTANPTTNSGPWNVYLAQDLTAADATPSFNDWTQAQVSDRPNHVEPICLSGLGCTTNTGPGGDRELGDFFKVALDSAGRAVISFADGNNKLGAEVAGGPAAAPSFTDVLRQATGPSLYSSVGTVPTIPMPSDSVTVASHSNSIPFASPACPCPSDDALTLLSSSTVDDGTNVNIQMTVKNLNATTATTAPGLGVATYLTRWWYGGQAYYAAAEINAAGVWSYFAGQVAPVSDGAAIKYAYYPATTAITGTVTSGASGTINLTVPVAAVGSPPSGVTLYSVTSYALTHALPTASTPPTASNFTDLPLVADVLPAYNTNAVPNTDLPEAPYAPALVVIGIGLIGAALYRRRRVVPAS